MIHKRIFMKFQYPCCCIGLCLFLVVRIYATEKNLPEDTSTVELCVSYADENENYFQLHGLKDVRLPPDPDWVYPDSIMCEEGHACSNRWETIFDVVLPNNDTSHSGFRIRWVPPSAKKKEIRHIAPIDEIELDPFTVFSDGHMPHAREYFRKHYGEKLRGVSTTMIESYNRIYLKHKVDVKLVGECGPLVVDEYCISGKNGIQLLETQIVDFFPVTEFTKGWIEMKCGKGYKVIKKLELDFGDYGKRTMGPYTKFSVCSNKATTISPDIQMPRYENIDLSNMALMRQKDLSSLYGKTVPVKWDAELQCSSSTIKKNGEYLIRIEGKCPEDEVNMDDQYPVAFSSSSQAWPESYEKDSCVVFSEEK